MAVEVDLTGGAVRVTATGKQPLQGILNVAGMDQVDLMCELLGWEGTFGASGPTIRILTSMHSDSDLLYWYVVGAFSGTSLKGSDRMDKANFAQLLKYIRWEVSNLDSATSLSFAIRGMGRSN